MKYYIVYSVIDKPAIKVLPTIKLADDFVRDMVNAYPLITWASFEAPLNLHNDCRVAMDFHCIRHSSKKVEDSIEAIRRHIKEERMLEKKR
jgi:hypothetical protein